MLKYNFINGFTFGAKDIDYKYIYEGSFTDTANNLLWSNVKTIGTQEAGTSIYIVQGVEASDAALTSSTTYTASLTYCGHADPVDIEFTTSSLGAPLTGSIHLYTFPFPAL